MKYKALFFICPYWGHIMPVIPLIKWLKRYGHHIIIYSTYEFIQMLTGLGISVEEYNFVERIQLHINRSSDNTSQLTTLLAAYKRRFEDQAVLVDYVIKELKEKRPNYIVYDYFDAYWAKLAAEKMGIPNIASVPTFAIHPNLINVAPEMCIKYVLCLDEKEKNFPQIDCRKFIDHINKFIGNKYNVPEFDLMDYGNSKILNLVHTSYVFQPFAEVFPERFKFIGIDEERHSYRFQKSIHFRFNNKVVVYVSMGTVEEVQRINIYKKCIAAYKDTEYQIIMSIGRVSREEFEELPENVRLYPFLSQGEMLKHANIFVTCGGMNSVNEALLCGVPMIMIPSVSDQCIVASQVVKIGGGIVLPIDFSVNMLIASTKELLKNKYSESCYSIGKTLKDSGGGRSGATEIMKVI